MPKLQQNGAPTLCEWVCLDLFSALAVLLLCALPSSAIAHGMCGGRWRNVSIGVAAWVLQCLTSVGGLMMLVKLGERSLPCGDGRGAP